MNLRQLDLGYSRSAHKKCVNAARRLTAKRFLNELAADELRGYLGEVNAARQTSQKALPPLEYKETNVKNTMTELTTGYKEVSDRAQHLHAVQSQVKETTNRYELSLKSAFDWIDKVETDVDNCVKKMPSGDSAELQRQLEETRNLQNRLVSEFGIIDDARSSADRYLIAIQNTDQYQNQKDRIESSCHNLDQRYEAAKEKLSSHANELQALLTQSQGVKAGLDQIQRWLEETEAVVNVSRPLPMNKEKLWEQSKEQQMLQADIDSRGPAIEGLKSDVEKLLYSSPSSANAGVSEGIIRK